ncbi:MAG TPA: AraC family transcriptional regulator [Candidatus Aminicenantes bacterium]|nr:AraC family transcriptional regulator [Candidatus Aminicenantes bacterium]
MRRNSARNRGKVLVLISKRDKPDFINRLIPFPASLRVVESRNRFPSQSGFSLVFHVCDYSCLTRNCLRSFISLQRLNTPIVVLRPAIFSKAAGFSKGFFLTFFDDSVLSPRQREMKETCERSRYYGWGQGRLHPSDPLHKVLLIQKDVVENPWRNHDLAGISKLIHRSPSWTSSTFKELTGVSLCRFVINNRFCYSLWKILSSDKSIKEIALDLGYRPLSFSGRFRSQFGIRPSRVINKYAYLSRGGSSSIKNMQIKK